VATPFSETDTLGTDFRFLVEVMGFDLGSWNSCKGLGITFKHEKVAELGQHAYNSYIPGRAEFTAVTLQRAMKSGDWDKTKSWLEAVTSDGWLVASADVKEATITMQDAKRQDVAQWKLKNAMPSSWKGPQLSATGKAVALETLEIVHEGFLDD
jgi:phage tail-like protein